MDRAYELRARLGASHPIIQAPMAAANTPELVAAVSNAGGLGMFGAAYLSPQQIAEAIAAIRARTDRPFGINLFAGGRGASIGVDSTPALSVLGPLHDEVGLPPPSAPQSPPDAFAAQIDTVIAEGVSIFSCTFGIPDETALATLKRHGVFTIGTATTVVEATMLEAAGVDAIVAQGSEAGAHRGTFAAPFDAAMIGTMALVPQVVDAVRVPVIASGGIMDGRGIVAAEALGASAVQMGTAFLTCPETGVPAAHKSAIRSSRAEQTVVTRVFSGRPARGIENDFVRAWAGHDEAILPFPLQNAATRPLRNVAASRDDARFLSLWSGQAGSLARDLPAGDLVRQLVQEAAELRATIGAST